MTNTNNKEQMNETDSSMNNIPFRNAQIVHKILSNNALPESEANKNPATA